MAPAMTLAVAMAVAIAGRLLVLRGATPRGRTWEVGAGRVTEYEAVARTFQRSVLILTTLMVLSSATTERLSGILCAAYWIAVIALFVLGLRDGQVRGVRWLQNMFLVAFALGLALSLVLGIIVHVAIANGVNEYVQSH